VTSHGDSLDPSDHDLGGKLLPAAQALALDAFAADVGAVLQSADIRFVLLKGPTVARWLYGTAEVRGYLDVDLLVHPDDLEQTRGILERRSLEISFLEEALPHGRRPHAENWVNPLGLSVDLHETLPGVGVDPGQTWAILSRDIEQIEVGGQPLPQLSEAGRALLVVLHAAHHGIKDEQAMADLARALDQVDEGTWRQATRLAELLDAHSALASGLRLLPPGRELADVLGLPVPRSIETILRAHSAPELALSLDWLLQTRGWRARAILVVRKLAPPRRVLQARSSLARRGAAGLVLAYVLQPAQVAARAAPAIRAWLAAREQSRRTNGGSAPQSSGRPPRP
jgi:hypothetical protein